MLNSVKLLENIWVENFGMRANPNKFKSKKKSYNSKGTKLKNYITTFTVFEKDLTINFENYNVFVGSNGIGKTLFFDNLIKNQNLFEFSKDCEIDFRIFKFSELNPQQVSAQIARDNVDNSNDDTFLSASYIYLQSHTKSHGENLKDFWEMFFKNFENQKKDGKIFIILDEPEIGLDLKTKIKFSKKLKALSKIHQIAIITHDYWFMKQADKLYNFDTKELVKTSEFFK
jgi:predicted ATPase